MHLWTSSPLTKVCSCVVFPVLCIVTGMGTDQENGGSWWFMVLCNCWTMSHKRSVETNHFVVHTIQDPQEWQNGLCLNWRCPTHRESSDGSVSHRLHVWQIFDLHFPGRGERLWVLVVITCMSQIQSFTNLEEVGRRGRPKVNLSLVKIGFGISK